MGKKFNVGDKVKVVKGNYCSLDTGAVGVISTLRISGLPYEVKFDHKTNYTHHGDGHYEELYRYYDEYNLELVEAKTYSTKYKPGDEVTVRSDMTSKAYYMADGKGYMTPTYQMLTKRGKKVKIKSVTKTGKYMIEGSIFPWTDEMFVDEAEVKPTGKKYKVGDHVKVKVYGEIMTGVIRCTKSQECYYGVEMDDVAYCGHDCSGFTLESGSTIQSKRGRWSCEQNVIGLVEEPKKELPEEIKPDKHSTTKFKVGDKIKAIDNHYAFTSTSHEWVGVVTEVLTCPGIYNFKAKTISCNRGYDSDIDWNLHDSHFELVEEAKPKNDNWKVVITPDGDKTTLEYFKDGKVEKTVTVNRFSEDEYSANAAIKATVDKLMLADKIAVTVKFDTGKGEYTYLTDDPSIEVDDRVVVPVGADNHPTLALVTAVTPFLVAKTTVPFRDLKYVIEKSHHNFKVGDKVVAKKDAPYGITTNGWEGVVTKISGARNIYVSNEKGWTGYNVEAKHFDLLKETPKETERKYYNGKVVCVSKKSNTAYTVGKVYEFIDGKIKLDNGCYFPTFPVATLEEWNENDSYYGKFIPFVE